jgi:hypothetical protein
MTDTTTPIAPKRIRHARGVKLPAGARLVARPSRWGNPFRISRVDCSDGLGLCWEVSDGRLTVTHLDTPARAHESAVEMFELHTGPMGNYEYDNDTLARLRRELGGRDLACYCPAGRACHADVLLRLANEEG